MEHSLEDVQRSIGLARHYVRHVEHMRNLGEDGNCYPKDLMNQFEVAVVAVVQGVWG